MEKIKKSFFVRFLYFLFFLVACRALWYAIFSPQFIGRVMDNVVIVLLSLALSIIGVVFAGKTYPLNDIIGNANQIIAILGLSLVFRFLANLVYLPAKLYLDAKDEAKSLRDKYEARIEPLVITRFEDESNHRVIGIRIENPNDYSLEHPIVQLVNLIWIKPPNGERVSVLVSEAFRGFREGANFHGNDHIPPREHAFICVAKASNEMIEFLMTLHVERRYGYEPNTNQFVASGKSEYEIELSIRGFINSHRLDEQKPTFNARFESDGRDLRRATITLVEHEQQETNQETKSSKE